MSTGGPTMRPAAKTAAVNLPVPLNTSQKSQHSPRDRPINSNADKAGCNIRMQTRAKVAIRSLKLSALFFLSSSSSCVKVHPTCPGR